MGTQTSPTPRVPSGSFPGIYLDGALDRARDFAPDNTAAWLHRVGLNLGVEGQVDLHVDGHQTSATAAGKADA